MYINTINGEYLIKKQPSIFMSRAGKNDCLILKQCETHGIRENNNKLYTIIAIIESETGEYIRDYEMFPPEITLLLLQQWGFITK